MVAAVVATDEGWRAPLERVGGPSVVALVDQQPTLLRLRLPIGTRAANLRVGRVESVGAGSSSRALAVSANGVDLEPVSFDVGRPFSIPLAETANAGTSVDGEPAVVDLELRLLALGEGIDAGCGLGSVQLSRVSVDVTGSPTAPATLDELVPTTLERLTIVMPDYPDDAVATAALQLATTADFAATPGLATRIVTADDPSAAASSNPWGRVIRLQAHDGSGSRRFRYATARRRSRADQRPWSRLSRSFVTRRHEPSPPLGCGSPPIDPRMAKARDEAQPRWANSPRVR